MKLLLIFVLSFLLSFVSCTNEFGNLQQGKQYNWVWDMIIFQIDFWLVFLFYPLFSLASFFANCPGCFTWWVNTVT